MLMTEKEAIAKACCSGSKRPAENGPCVGSNCMAWRWREFRTTQETVVVEGPPGQSTGKNVGKQVPFKGYCGLAGGVEVS